MLGRIRAPREFFEDATGRVRFEKADQHTMRTRRFGAIVGESPGYHPVAPHVSMDQRLDRARGTEPVHGLEIADPDKSRTPLAPRTLNDDQRSLQVRAVRPNLNVCRGA